MKPPLRTLKELGEFIEANGYPSELTISCEDFNRINDKLHPNQRATSPGRMMYGCTLVKAKNGPPLDVSDERLFE